MTTETITDDAPEGVTDKRSIEQISAGAAGLLVCGLVTAIIWFFAVQSIRDDGLMETGALDCASAASYGVNEDVSCTTP